MFDRMMLASAIVLGLTTTYLLLWGRRPLGWPWRIVLMIPTALVAAIVAGLPRAPALGVLASPAVLTTPGGLVTVAALAIALVSPRKWWAAGAVLFGSLAVATTIYCIYLIRVTVVLATSIPGLVLGLVLLAIEFAALGLMVAALFEVLDALCRPLTVERLPDPPAQWPTVCLQVPAHDEPPDLVIRTLRSLVEIDYPRDSLVVQLLDDNTSDESLWKPVEAECARLREAGHRVEFVHLQDWPGYKAGALNWGRAHLPGDVEIVGIVDADYLVDPSFLTATVAYFRDPTVSFVQTPQEYRAWQESAFYRACHTGFAYFFRVGMVSRSYRNSIIFAGTMGLIRRSDLDAVGGWDESIITEDAETSLRMLNRRGRGIYVPHSYGRGIMPLTYEALRGQRFRWAFGGIQILRKHWRELLPWSGSNLSQRQRRDYLLGGLWWFNDALTLGFTAFIAATAVGVVTGHPFVVQRLAGLGIVLPLLYIALGLIRYVWGIRVATGVSMGEAVAAMRINMSLSWVITLACVRGLVEDHGVFLRTPKFAGTHSLREIRVVLVETMLAIASLALGVWVFLVAGISLLTLTVDVLLAWAVFTYGSATLFALGDPTRPPASLRGKADLERNPPAGGAVRTTAVGAGFGLALVVLAIFVVGALAGEANRPSVGGDLPFEGTLSAPVHRGPTTAQRPASTPRASSSPAASSPPASAAPSTPQPTPPATPSPTPVPATPVPSTAAPGASSSP